MSTIRICAIVLALWLLLILALSISGGSPRTVYIMVTPTSQPTYELFKGECASYCPTPGTVAQLYSISE